MRIRNSQFDSLLVSPQHILKYHFVFMLKVVRKDDEVDVVRCVRTEQRDYRSILEHQLRRRVHPRRLDSRDGDNDRNVHAAARGRRTAYYLARSA